jgi:cysteine desulfurase
MAMGLSRQEAQSSLRLSLGWDTSDADLERFTADLVRIVHRVRSLKSTSAFAVAP